MARVAFVIYAPKTLTKIRLRKSSSDEEVEDSTLEKFYPNFWAQLQITWFFTLTFIKQTMTPPKYSEGSIFNVILIYLLNSFLYTDLPRGNRHERDSWVPCEVPSLPNPTTRKGWPHHRGLYVQLFSNSGVGSFTSLKNRWVKVLWDGTYRFSSLSGKIRKSNRLQILLQGRHFLPSYLKTPSVGPIGVWTRDLPLSRPALSQLSSPPLAAVTLLFAGVNKG